MPITDCISDIVSSLGNLFETNQENVIKAILKAEKVFFLDTCFVTKSLNLKTEDLIEAFEKMADGKQKEKIVFVVTGLILYELKDSKVNELQKRNRDFFEKVAAQGFGLYMLNEETVCENIRPFMNYSIKNWNEFFASLIHDNIANLSFGGVVKTDSRMPYYGFSQAEFRIPDDGCFVNDIIVYLKNTKTSKDSLAEELICTSLFFIFKLTNGSTRNEYIFCTHDFGAIARLNKAIQTSFPNMQKQFKTINVFAMVQYMVKEGIITSKQDTLIALRKIMGKSVKLIIRNDIPFSSVEKTITIDEAIEKIFNNEQVELVGRHV